MTTERCAFVLSHSQHEIRRSETKVKSHSYINTYICFKNGWPYVYVRIMCTFELLLCFPTFEFPSALTASPTAYTITALSIHKSYWHPHPLPYIRASAVRTRLCTHSKAFGNDVGIAIVATEKLKLLKPFDSTTATPNGISTLDVRFKLLAVGTQETYKFLRKQKPIWLSRQ